MQDEEIEIIRSGITRLASLREYEYKIDARKDKVILYLLDQDMDELAALFSEFLTVKQFDPASYAKKSGTYTAMMCFHLRDEGKRVFEAERYCFLGGIDHWVPIGSPGKLKALVGRFVKHLGKESFFEIEPYCR